MENKDFENLSTETAKKISEEIMKENQKPKEENATFDKEKFNEYVNKRIKEELHKDKKQEEIKPQEFNEEKHEQEIRIELMDNNFKLIEQINNIPHQTKIHNIAISYNNKKSEIEGMLKRNGKNPYKDNLYNICSWHLMKTLRKGMDNINIYIGTIEKIIRLFPLEQQLKKIESLEKYLQKYEKISTEIDDFSIEKDIVEAFNSYKNHFEENAKNGRYSIFFDIDINEYIKECNDELKELGFNVRIPIEKQKEENPGKKL